MALEAVVFPQDPLFSSSSSYPTTKDYFYSSFLPGGAPSWTTHHHDYEEKLLIGIINNNNNNNNNIFEQQSSLHHHHATTTTTTNNNNNNNSESCNNSAPSNNDQWDHHSHYSTSSPDCVDQPSFTATTTGRRKRRRTKTTKNKEEIENQRMTHIAVERNRRKQMNDYLAVLRSLMPPSYVQRGDQASIIGGAINFVKELEQLLQSMEGQKKPNHHDTARMNSSNKPSSSPFAEFFTFPQYTTTTATEQQQQKQWPPAVADIEVTMVDSHANLKILSKKRNGQLMKMVVGLRSLRLTILHLNVTTLHDLVLYSVSVKVEEGCQLNTVDEIAAAVNQLLSTLQEASSSFNSIN